MYGRNMKAAVSAKPFSPVYSTLPPVGLTSASSSLMSVRSSGFFAVINKPMIIPTSSMIIIKLVPHLG